MLASEGRARTRRASRYLTQLCQHGGQMRALRRRHSFSPAHGRGHDDGGAVPVPQHTEVSGSGGIIDFGWGRCALQATGEELVLSAEADDQQQLRQIQDALAARLAQIGRRDRLAVTWGPAVHRPGSA